MYWLLVVLALRDITTSASFAATKSDCKQLTMVTSQLEEPGDPDGTDLGPALGLTAPSFLRR
jgi:hypothetical protein